jgi:uncharacterized protein YxjI
MALKDLAYGVGLASLLAGAAYASPESDLRSANEIKIEEANGPHMGKDYDLKLDGEIIAKVAGKNVRGPFSGDVFTLATIDGTVLASEKEDKRGLFEMNRAAAIYDCEGNLWGYIGEKRERDWFSIAYIFHIFDADKREIGKSQKITNSCWGKHTIQDAKGNVDYDVDKKWDPNGDTYVVKVKDPDSQIPLEWAIFMVCIEDAIKDAHESDD